MDSAASILWLASRVPNRAGPHSDHAHHTGGPRGGSLLLLRARLAIPHHDCGAISLYVATHIVRACGLSLVLTILLPALVPALVATRAPGHADRRPT